LVFGRCPRTHVDLRLDDLARPRRSPPFPYTTLLRSAAARVGAELDLPAAGGRVRGDLAFHPVIALRTGIKPGFEEGAPVRLLEPDRKSTRLNSSHVKNSYAVFCVKKKTGERGLRRQS